ncbi:MAG: extracellular solute-binding protein [Paenibacillus sp.]|uniref:extracellular solute-binding protein n=1 Tax=Paenibacillus sp. TaxID=58172 RepID=UPI0025FD061B|nr:extracellular solute-binding protein [Paenibacillus sp.]MBR2563589.1 extracellular solute-binding protein [Paenibacillus sp.]
MKRRHQIVLFAVLLLSLTILSPSFDFRGSHYTQERNPEKDTYPGASSLSHEKRAPLDVTVSMSKEEFESFYKLAEEVAASRYIQVKLRNVESEEYKKVLDQEFSLGENGDIILLNSDDVQYYAKKGYLVPLNGTALSKSLGDTIIELRVMTEWNGYQWGMPFDFDPYIIGATASFLNKADLQGLPQNKDQWSKVIKAAQIEDVSLISMNIEDICGASAWMGSLPLGMSPDQIITLQPTSLVNELQQGITLLNELQPQIKTLSEDPVGSASNVKMNTPMFVSTLSRILQEDEAAGDKDRLVSDNLLKPLHAVESRSLVITSGSVEADAASRWIEGMLSASTQKKWFDETKRLSARKEEMKQGAEDSGILNEKFKNQSWFSKDYDPVQSAKSREIVMRFEKQVKQLLRGQINAAQYVSSIRKATNR